VGEIQDIRMPYINMLESGLLLEDRDILLPWGARVEQLCHDGLPSKHIHDTAWEELFWQRPVILHGLSLRYLQVVVYPHGWLDSGWAWLECCSLCHPADVSFERALYHLTGLLGKPSTTEPYPHNETVRQLAVWECPRWRIGLSVRTGTQEDAFRYASLLHIARR
jgi:hypothetical protein